MGAEIGATTSLFAYDEAMDPLPPKAPDAKRWRDALPVRGMDLTSPIPTTRCSPTPAAFYDEVIEIDLSGLGTAHQRPAHTGPGRPVSSPGCGGRRRGLARRKDLRGPHRQLHELSATRTSEPRQQPGSHAAEQGLNARTDLLVTPGSEQVRATIERDGFLGDLEAVGATVLANACGPCIGQWDRSDVDARGRRRT